MWRLWWWRQWTWVESYRWKHDLNKYNNTCSHAIALSIMHSIKCNLNSATSSVSDFPMSRNLQEMHRSVGKITDENILLFSSQTKFAAIIPFNADNHVISLSSGKKKVCTLFATLKRSCCYFLICVMNRTVIFQTYWNTLEMERCFWYQWTLSGAIIIYSAEGILVAISIITFLNYSLTMWHFFGPMPNLLAVPCITVGYIKE